MKILHTIVIMIMIIAIMVTYYEDTLIFPKTTKSSCLDPELTVLQYDQKRLATRQQVDSIALSNPEIKGIIDGNTYCEFMGLSASSTENGIYQTININLNNTKNLVVQVNLKNNSVISYELLNLTRSYK